ncbi:hypothetical protein [Streptomyces sp. B15]|uniref:hypothetical protein n=1 Tax=Streptomyces sp. B15 TaxID=1537797 RepID=UPI001B3666C1|nr:hypothetical protein [Streptomyces sp. B15]MBQ1123887.1 hypothetical protein [Streptomyces sp. B15]
MSTRTAGQRRRGTPLRTVGAAGLALGMTALLAGPSSAGARDGDGGPDAASASKTAAHKSSTAAHKKSRDKLPPPPQMREMQRLLGSWKCVEVSPPPPNGIEKTVSYVKVKKAMGGHFSYSTISIEPGTIRARDVTGWNPVDRVYFRQYHDNWGTTSITTSPGWKDGHLVFTGEFIGVSEPDPDGEAEGAHMKLTDDYKWIGPGRFDVTSTVSLPGGGDYPHTAECHRID